MTIYCTCAPPSAVYEKPIIRTLKKIDVAEGCLLATGQVAQIIEGWICVGLFLQEVDHLLHVSAFFDTHPAMIFIYNWDYILMNAFAYMYIHTYK